MTTFRVAWAGNLGDAMDTRVDFAYPKAPQKRLSAWDELCQAILLSSEFAVME